MKYASRSNADHEFHLFYQNYVETLLEKLKFYLPNQIQNSEQEQNFESHQQIQNSEQDQTFESHHQIQNLDQTQILKLYKEVQILSDVIYYKKDSMTDKINQISIVLPLVAKLDFFPYSQCIHEPSSQGFNENRSFPYIGQAVVVGLAIGDSLGATSEFSVPWQVTDFFYGGWPSSIIGGGPWEAGDPTDDTDLSMAILQSYANMGKFDPEDICRNFLKWLKTDPRDVGYTTSVSLSKLNNNPKNYSDGGYKALQLNPTNASNGSLMRNGPIPALLYTQSNHTIIEASVLHGIITHYDISSVLSCVVHSLLICRGLRHHQRILIDGGEGIGAPTFLDVCDVINGPWKEWKNNTTHAVSIKWLNDVKNDLLEMEGKFLEELKGFESMDPYHLMYKGISGWCILSLKISLWALHWSFKDTVPSCGVPAWLPVWPFKKHGYRTIMWIALIGADADTYGAIGGSLLAAYHPYDIPRNFVQQIKVFGEIEEAFKTLREKSLI